ncbi:PAS domain S-box protein [Archangium violaceum]|uniref:ATP-binding protein n=1 Tax=Archangium violaceum TaxID=83451 RepID=UPI002B2DC0A2|nr:PAS domain S-box protein [Archangium violaceum]
MASARPLRVLSVEDSSDDAELIRLVLRQGGFAPSFLRVATPEAMREALRQEPWDIILSDFSMPHFSGREALALLKAEGLDVPFIIISGSVGEDVAVQAMKAGAQDFFRKDNLARLPVAVERELREAEIRRESRRVSAALHEVEHQQGLLLDSIKDYAIFGLSPDGFMTTWNPGVERVKGYTAEEFIGQPFSILFTPEDRERDVPAWELRQAATEGFFEGEGVRLRKDGLRFHAEVVLRPIRDERGVLTGFVKVVRDISVRKRHERHLRFLAEASTLLVNSLDMTETLSSLARLAVPMLADLCAVETLADDGSLHLAALVHVDPAREALARELRDRYPRRPETAQGVLQAIRTGRAELMPEIPESLRVREAQGDAERLRAFQSLGVESYLVVPLAARGRTIGAISFSYTESGRRYDEEDLRLAEELARRASLAFDNSLLYQHAQEAIRLRDEFLSVASHELKTPLTSLLVRLQSLRREAQRAPQASLSAERVISGLESAEAQVRRLGTLIHEFLDVSRISVGTLALELDDVDLVVLVRDVIRRFEAQAAKVACPVLVHAPHAVSGRWDRMRLEQVVGHLLSNALKYGAGKPIHLHVESQEGSATLTVRDEGIGIQPEHLSRIFGKFERAVSERHYGGLGLGLYTARRIVEAMGGRISVRSTPGQGASFEVSLPSAPP